MQATLTTLASGCRRGHAGEPIQTSGCRGACLHPRPLGRGWVGPHGRMPSVGHAMPEAWHGCRARLRSAPRPLWGALRSPTPPLSISQPGLLISQPTLLVQTSKPTLLLSQPTLLGQTSQPTLLVCPLPAETSWKRFKVPPGVLSRVLPLMRAARVYGPLRQPESMLRCPLAPTLRTFARSRRCIG